MSGIQNLGGTCYLNSLVQALLGIECFVKNLDTDEFGQKFLARDTKYLLKKLSLPQGASCVHETWLKMLDSELAYIKPLFEMKYEINDKKEEVVTEVLSPSDVFAYKDEFDRRFVLVNRPKVITVITKKYIGDLDNYKLVSFINYTGGHYNCNSIRGDKSFFFDDIIVKEAPMAPTHQSLIYFYELC